MTRKSLPCLLLAVGAAGCGSSRKEPYPVWATVDTPYQILAGSGNAFDGYLRAGELAVQAAPSEADRVTFTESARANASKKLSSALSVCAQAARRDCRFEHRVTALFGAEPPTRGWRLLGRGMVWRIEDAVAQGNFDSAVTWTVTATKFGFDLTQGDAQSASLGFTVCDDARRALAPSIKRLSAAQATNLHIGLARILTKFPGLQQAVRNEEKRVLLGVQFVQDCQERNAYKTLEERLGKSARPGIEYLRGLSDSKRADFFEDFARSMKSFVDDWVDQVDEPRSERTLGVEPETTGTWRRFGRAFSGTIAPMASMRDATLARTRLLAVSAWALAKSKKTGQAPFKLDALAVAVSLDPYNGKPLVYTALGPDFRVYSVGADGRDDGGDSDESGLAPDVVLESDDF